MTAGIEWKWFLYSLPSCQLQVGRKRWIWHLRFLSGDAAWEGERLRAGGAARRSRRTRPCFSRDTEDSFEGSPPPSLRVMPILKSSES